jgi:hypothetical protein
MLRVHLLEELVSSVINCDMLFGVCFAATELGFVAYVVFSTYKDSRKELQNDIAFLQSVTQNVALIGRA